MRIVCFHPARDPVMCGEGPVHVGSAPGDAVVLDGAGVEARHLAIVADARGLVLKIRPGCQRIYVNARAVREQALLHYGDTITLGANKFLVTSNSAPAATAAGGDPGTPKMDVVLRIASGPAAGQALRVMPELHLGEGSGRFTDLPYACRIAQVAGKLTFESRSNLPRINGWRRNSVALAPNDQIVLGEHRLLVEAPSLQYARHLTTLPPPAPRPPETPEHDDPPPPTEIWWLIGAAAVLATVIALFLYFRW